MLDHVVFVTVVFGCSCMGAKRDVPVCNVYGTVNDLESTSPPLLYAGRTYCGVGWESSE